MWEEIAFGQTHGRTEIDKLLYRLLEGWGFKVRKKCFIDREKLLKFKAEIFFFFFLKSLQQFIQTAHGQYNF